MLNISIILPPPPLARQSPDQPAPTSMCDIAMRPHGNWRLQYSFLYCGIRVCAQSPVALPPWCLRTSTTTTTPIQSKHHHTSTRAHERSGAKSASTAHHHSPVHLINHHQPPLPHPSQYPAQSMPPPSTAPLRPNIFYHCRYTASASTLTRASHMQITPSAPHAHIFLPHCHQKVACIARNN